MTNTTMTGYAESRPTNGQSHLFCNARPLPYAGFFNPYSAGRMTFPIAAMMLLTSVGLIAAVKAKPYFMLAVFLVSFVPMGFYMLGTPGLFKWIGVFNLVFLFASPLMLAEPFVVKLRQKTNHFETLLFQKWIFAPSAAQLLHATRADAALVPRDALVLPPDRVRRSCKRRWDKLAQSSVVPTGSGATPAHLRWAGVFHTRVRIEITHATNCSKGGAKPASGCGSSFSQYRLNHSDTRSKM